jgi:hypothetical protein
MYIKEKTAQTVLSMLSPQGLLIPAVVLPSGGDTSYPGIVKHKGKLFVSYYSSHEEKPSIYLAVLKYKSR